MHKGGAGGSFPKGQYQGHRNSLESAIGMFTLQAGASDGLPEHCPPFLKLLRSSCGILAPCHTRRRSIFPPERSALVLPHPQCAFKGCFKERWLKGHGNLFASTMGHHVYSGNRSEQGGRRHHQFLGPLQCMGACVQSRRHAQAPQGPMLPAKKGYRACKKIPVSLL